MIIIQIVFFLFTFVNSQNLIFVFSHFRHGARAPLVDNNISVLKHYWKNGGELTNVGKRQQYTLGLYNRHKYKNFLSNYYNPSEIFVISSNFNRTILSANSQLQGLYPPGSQPDFPMEKFNKSIPPISELESKEQLKRYAYELSNETVKEKVTNIPVHVFNEKEKILILPNSNKCPKIKKLKNDEDKLKSIAKEFNEKYGKYIYKYIKKDKDYFNNFLQCSTFCDTFIAEYFDKRDFQEFKNQTGIKINDLYSGCQNIHFNLYYTYIFGTNKINIAFATSSPLVKYILSFLKNRVNYHLNQRKKIFSKEPIKMLMVSLHDSTLSGMQVFLKNIFKDVPYLISPNYASNLVFEIYQNETKNTLSYSDYYVEYRFNDSLLMTVNLNEFVNTLENNIWDSKKIEDYCMMTDNFDKDYEQLLKKSLIAVVICSVISVVFFFITFIIFLVKNKCSFSYNKNIDLSNSEQDEHLNEE